MLNQTISAEDTIKSKEILGGLSNLTDVSCDFYYDETNNYRKFHLTSGKLNIQDAGEFLLGGVVVEKGRAINITELKKEIRLDKSAKELKFKHVAKGGLHDVLKSNKVKIVLDFVKSEHINLHFLRLNSFYWGIIDIIESIQLPQHLVEMHWELKDCLYISLTYNLNKTLQLFYEYGYPDIKSKDIYDFYSKISELVKITPITNSLIHNLLLNVLKIGACQNEVIFIQDEKRRILLDDYSPFYRDRILTFPNSRHIFDMEENIKGSFAQIECSFQGNHLKNYDFIVSHENDGIQLSDVIIGLISKIINYCNNQEEDYLLDLRHNLSSTERSTLNILSELLEQSNNVCQGYFQNIVPLSNMAKYGILLQDLCQSGSQGS